MHEALSVACCGDLPRPLPSPLTQSLTFPPLSTLTHTLHFFNRVLPSPLIPYPPSTHSHTPYTPFVPFHFDSITSLEYLTHTITIVSSIVLLVPYYAPTQISLTLLTHCPALSVSLPNATCLYYYYFPRHFVPQHTATPTRSPSTSERPPPVQA